VSGLPSWPFLAAAALAAVVTCGAEAGAWQCSSEANVPADISAVFGLPRYEAATWGLRVVDADHGKVLIDLQPTREFLIGSVRKIFSVGELLNQVGPNYTYNTPLYVQGDVGPGGYSMEI
jgi:D-alanyl-D-alanine carboxypeptidase